jgi:hypothetical protein
MTSSFNRAQLIAISIVAMWSTVAMSADPAAHVPLAGSYKYVGGDAEVKALFASVEAVVKRMSFMVRGIARKRLRKPNMPSAELDLTIDPNMITVARTGGGKVAAPRNGTPAKWRSPDGTFMVKYVLDGRTLLQTMDGKNSHSTNRFTLAEDGVTLTVQTKIVSSRLPGPVVFVMTYRKQ